MTVTRKQLMRDNWQKKSTLEIRMNARLAWLETVDILNEKRQVWWKIIKNLERAYDREQFVSSPIFHRPRLLIDSCINIHWRGGIDLSAQDEVKLSIFPFFQSLFSHFPCTHETRTFYFFFFFFTPSTEADRDTLDWSGCKPLDYRKQSTSVSASTYSSKYGQTPKSGGHTTPFSMAGSNHENAFNTMKLKRSKRFATADHSMMRSYSMRGSTTSVATPKRSTFFFSPEMDVGKRNQKYYRSFLFRKKPLTLTKTEGDGN